MATLNATLSLTSTDVSSSSLSFTVTDALIVGTPNIGMSREVASITTPTTLVPATAGTKYCYVKHLGLKANGVSTSANNVNLQTVTAAPVRQVQTITFTNDPGSGDTITPTVDGVSLAAVTYTTSVDNTFVLLNAALAAQPGILSSTHVTTSGTTVVTVTSANLGDSTTITVATDVTGGAAVSTTAGSGGRVAASGASVAVLRPGEFLFLPVKSGEGFSAVSAGVVSADACMLEYAYWTKSVE